MGNDWEAYLAVGWLALWVLFPVGIFLSVGRLDGDTDELGQMAARGPIRNVGEARFMPSRKEKHLFHVNWTT